MEAAGFFSSGCYPQRIASSAHLHQGYGEQGPPTPVTAQAEMLRWAGRSILYPVRLTLNPSPRGEGLKFLVPRIFRQ
jgi:hypothetical protein